MHTPGDFVLHGGNTAFANRQKLLFDKLSDAEQECNRNKMAIETKAIDVDDKSSKPQTLATGTQKHKSDTKRFRGKESIFKRPEGPAPRAANRNIPDFRRNPHKWKKYSLDDVSNDDMTEQSNTRAALSFLKELKTRRLMEQKEESEKMDIDDSESIIEQPKKIVFKHRRINTSSEVKFKKPESDMVEMDNIVVDSDDKPIFRSSKIIMPEYVVGQTQKKKHKKEKTVVKVDRLKQLKLDHLDEPDEEED